MSENPSQEQISTAATILNNAGYNAASALQIRLDMREEISMLQTYLLGLQIVFEEDSEGNNHEVARPLGIPLVNDRGYQACMGWIQSVIMNKHTVMGNLIDDEWYGNYMCDLHKDVWFDLLVNRNDYGISIKMLQPIHSKLMMAARLILTRTIGDKERIGMNNTTRIEERTQTQAAKQGAFSGFFGGKK